MLLTLPGGGRTFRMISPDDITLNDQILCQQKFGIGPMQLQARLGANAARWRSMAPILQSLQEATSDDERFSLMLKLEAELAYADVDMFAEGVHIWLSRRAAGEREISMEEACDFPFFRAVRELEPHEQRLADEERAAEARADADPTSPSSGAGTPTGPGPNRAARRARPKSTSPTT
jgi:hypothetical protein